MEIAVVGDARGVCTRRVLNGKGCVGVGGKLR